MIKLATLFWLAAVATAGFAMFAVKYEVQSLADQLARTSKQTDDTERDIRALTAEWAYLNRPDALAELNQRLLSLVPIATKQLRTSLTDIPMRPAPLPAPPPPAQAAVPSGETPAVAPGAATSDQAAVAAVSTPPSPAVQPAASPPLAETVVALDTAVAARPAAPAPVRTPARASRPRRAASLDELIAQITETR
jgi:hypothetical protein